MLNPHLFRTDYLSQKRTEIANIAVKRFRQGYTLVSIAKCLTKSYRPITGLGSSEIGEIVGKAILDFVIKENRGNSI